MDNMTQTAAARVVAYLAHRGQVRTGPAPQEAYFEHLRRVAGRFHPGHWACAVGWLHDVVEDTDVTADDLRAMGFRPEVVDAVVLLTHPHGVTHEEYLDCVRPLADPADTTAVIARAVKLADLADNIASLPSMRALGLTALAYRLETRWTAAQAMLLEAAPRLEESA